MLFKTFEISWFKKYWFIFEFRLIILFVDLLPSLIKKIFHLLYS